MISMRSCLSALSVCLNLLVASGLTFNHTAFNIEKRLRDRLLQDYDVQAVPLQDGKPLNVSLGLNLYRIKNVDLNSGILEINAWLRMGWIDERLKWNITEYNVPVLNLYASSENLESSQIWVPDAELYAGAESLENAPKSPILVYPNGYVFWSRPHVYQIICTFVGAELFPYSTFNCDFKIGGWGQSGLKVNYDDLLGVEIFNLEVNPEYIIDAKHTHSYVEVSYYSCCPNEPWPIVHFNIGMKSQDYMYTKSIIFTNMAFVYLSFGLFWFDLNFKLDLLSLGATYALSLVAVDFITSSAVPITSEILWIEEFLSYSLSVTLINIVLMSVAVYYEMINEKEMRRFERDLTKKRGDRHEYLASVVGICEEDWRSQNVSPLGYMAVKVLYWSTPGGHVPQSIEDYGMHHWGEVVTFVAGFIMPFIYGVALIYLGDRLLKSYSEDMLFENESGYYVSLVMLFLGYVTVLLCICSQFCEFVSRIYSYNPKTNVTNQDTFIKRASLVDRPSGVRVDAVEVNEWDSDIPLVV